MHLQRSTCSGPEEKTFHCIYIVTMAPRVRFCTANDLSLSHALKALMIHWMNKYKYQRGYQTGDKCHICNLFVYTLHVASVY